MARAALALTAGVASALVVVGGTSLDAGATAILPPDNPSASVPPQVVPACTTVGDHTAGCIDSVLHNINYARSLEGLGPLVLPLDYATDPAAVQLLVLTDEERSDRGLPLVYSGLDSKLNSVALTGAEASTDPGPLPPGFEGPGGSIFAQDETPLGADFAWMYDDGYGGTNLDCASPSDSGCWGHRDNILGNWTSISGETAMMGDANTPTGQYTEIFAYQTDPADSVVDPTTISLPTPSPDVVQVLPSSSPNTGAGTPVTIEGDYFGTSPQVSFGGVPATNVQVNWDGELTADAPADPQGTATDQVPVTVSKGAPAAAVSPANRDRSVTTPSMGLRISE